MTDRELKKLAIAEWEFFIDHPWINGKEKLPIEIYNKIKGMINKCVLCEKYRRMNICEGCPIDYCFDNGLYFAWNDFRLSMRERVQKAEWILQAIRRWKV